MSIEEKLAATKKRQNFLGQMVKDGKLPDLVQNASVELDSIRDDNSSLDVPALTLANIGDTTTENKDTIVLDAMMCIGDAISKNQEFMDTVTADALNGGALAAVAITASQTVIKNAPLGNLVGTLSSFERASTVSKSMKFKVYSLDPIVKKDSGSFIAGDEITPLNIGSPMALMKQSLIQSYDALVVDYVFNIKNKGVNYPIARGVSSVLIGDNYEVNDYEVSAKEKNFSKTVTDQAGKTSTVVINYVAGTITVSVVAGFDIIAGDAIFVESSCDFDKPSELRGTVGHEVGYSDYIAHPITIGTESSLTDIRLMQENLNIGLLPLDMTLALEKTKAENQRMALTMASVFRKRFGDAITLDMTTSSTTRAETYSPLTTAITLALTQMNTLTQLGDRGEIYGGMELIKWLEGLSKEGGLNVLAQSSDNGIKRLGVVNAKTTAYYDPLHDIKNPLVDVNGVVSAVASENVYHTLSIYGTPYQHEKRLVVTALALPIIPIDLQINTDSKKGLFLEGHNILAINKEQKSRKLAMKILFRIKG